MTKIEAAGYILHDNNRVIWGAGESVNDAWADLKYTLASSQTVLISEGDQAPDDGRNWERESDYQVTAASAALLDAVHADGGLVKWTLDGSVACTQAEFDEAYPL